MKLVSLSLLMLSVLVSSQLVVGAQSVAAQSVTPSVTAQGVRMPAYERVVLPNGTVLLLMERHDVPLIAMQATMRGGATLDAPDKAGTASLLAQLLVKGAGKRDAAQFAEAIAEVGGTLDTSISTESINVQGQFMARDQQLMIELLADLLLRPRLDATQFNDVRQRQIERLRAAKDSNVGALTPVYAAAALFGEHPYGLPLNGSEATLARINSADVEQLYRQQVGADRLSIAIAGDFKAAQLMTQLRKAFGDFHRATAALPSIKPVTPVSGRRVVLIDAPESAQTYFWLGNVGVAHKDDRRVTLDLINTLLGGRFTSMLNTELRINSGLTYGARSQLRRLTQSGSWNIYSFTRTDSTVAAIDLALQTYERLRAQGLDDSALTSGRNYVLGQFSTDYETAAQWAAALAELEFYKLPRSEIDEYAARLQRVDATQAKQVIASALPNSSDLLMVLIGDASKIRSQIAKYGPVTELPLSAPEFSMSR